MSQLFSTLLASPLLLPMYHSCNNPPRLCLSGPGFTLERESRFYKHCVIDIRVLQEDLSVLPIAFRIKSDPFPQLPRTFVICLPLGSYSSSPAHVLPGLVVLPALHLHTPRLLWNSAYSVLSLMAQLRFFQAALLYLGQRCYRRGASPEGRLGR